MSTKIIIAVARKEGKTIIRNSGMDLRAVDRLMKDLMAAETAAEAVIPQNEDLRPQDKVETETAAKDNQVATPAGQDVFDVTSEKVKMQTDKFNAISAQVKRVIALPKESFDRSKATLLAKRLIKAEFEIYELLEMICDIWNADEPFLSTDRKNIINKLIDMAGDYERFQSRLRIRALGPISNNPLLYL